MRTKQLQRQLYKFVNSHNTFYANEMPAKMRNAWLTKEPLDKYLSENFDEQFEYGLFYAAYLRYCQELEREPENKASDYVIKLFKYFQQFLVFRNRFEDDLDLFDFDRYEEMHTYIFQVYLLIPRLRPTKSKESDIHIVIIFILVLALLLFILFCI